MTALLSDASTHFKRVVAGGVALIVLCGCTALTQFLPAESSESQTDEVDVRPINVAKLSCANLVSRAECAVETDCAAQCNRGIGAACEALARSIATDQQQATHWENRCRHGNRSSSWCTPGQAEEIARRLLSRACNLGDGLGCFGLTSLYVANTGLVQHPGELGDVTKRTNAILSKACECGNKDGCSALAKMYVTGAQMMLQKTPPREFDAAVLLVEACKLGDLDACHEGLRVVTSGSREFDPELVNDFSIYACKNGDQEACALRICSRAARLSLERQGMDVSRAALAKPMIHCTLAMKNAGPKTANDVASCFDSKPSLDCLEPIGGVRVVPVDQPESGADRKAQDSPEAIKQRLEITEGMCSETQWCETACDGGNSYACLVLGGKYWDGNGVPSNPARGTALYRSACEKDNSAACMALEHVTRAAAECKPTEDCEMACKATLWPACLRLGDAYLQGEGVKRNAVKAISFFKKACDGGDGSACNALASVYIRGLGVSRNLSQAEIYFQKACDQGKQDACDNVRGAQCVSEAIAPGKRRPTLDPYCNPRGGRAARPGEPMPIKAFVAGDASLELESDDCYTPLRSIGCTGFRAQSVDKSGWCCK